MLFCNNSVHSFLCKEQLVCWIYHQYKQFCKQNNLQGICFWHFLVHEVLLFLSLLLTPFRRDSKSDGTANCLKWFLNLIELLFNFIVYLPFIFKQVFLCSIKTSWLLKHFKQYLQECFLFLFFVLLHINLLKFLI